ncbi:MAG: Wzz/FepE/Etk N-terminal domain-containing protein [Steroidobacteraceae bacterium]
MEQSVSQKNAQAYPDDIDLGQFFSRIFQHWITIGAIVVAAIALAIGYLHAATYEYTAELKVTPVDSGASGLAGSLSGLGGLASMVGVNISTGQGVAPSQLYVESLQSRDAARLLIDHESLMHVAFAKEWNASTGKWQEPSGVLRSIKRGVLSALGVPVSPWHAPDEADLQAYLEKNVSVDQDTKTKVITLSTSHADPQFAVQLISALDRAVDNDLRRRALERAQANIEYLSQKLGSVSIAEHRQAIAEALSEQEKQIMMASSGAPFAAEPFGMAAASSEPTNPKPVLVLMLGAVLGFLLACALVLVAFPATPTGKN